MLSMFLKIVVNLSAALAVTAASFAWTEQGQAAYRMLYGAAVAPYGYAIGLPYPYPGGYGYGYAYGYGYGYGSSSGLLGLPPNEAARQAACATGCD